MTAPRDPSPPQPALLERTSDGWRCPGRACACAGAAAAGCGLEPPTRHSAPEETPGPPASPASASASAPAWAPSLDHSPPPEPSSHAVLSAEAGSGHQAVSYPARTAAEHTAARTMSTVAPLETVIQVSFGGAAVVTSVAPPVAFREERIHSVILSHTGTVTAFTPPAPPPTPLN